MARAKSIAPITVRSKRELAALQRAMLSVLMEPLGRDNHTRRRIRDGRSTAVIAARIAKPNDRLTAFERIEIYNRSYWFRILDSLYEDCPGLRAVIGDRKFTQLAEAFMVKYPSHYWTLRDLPQRLPKFLREEPRWTKPYTALCVDLARFEWAQVEVYDGAAYPVFTLDDLLDANPARLRLGFQPYIQLLELDYAVDDFIVALRRQDAVLRGDTSNAPTVLKAAKLRKVKLPAREHCYVAVHRHGGKIYFKRLEPAAYKILKAIRAGQPLARALSAGIPRATNPREDWPAKVQGWFSAWMELGWFCRR
ncbi:MAG: putative DNA-binding domain-containing protein [Opitutae bacterium]|nr:putative DNA-binding domain-containing protein [Opitutae bacterium]